MQRAFITALLLATALLISAALYWQQPPIQKISGKLLGESWYQIELADKHVGFMHNLARQDLDGNWHFTTTTHFRLDSSTATTIQKQLQFSAHSPHELVNATYHQKQNGQHHQTTIEKSGGHYLAQLSRNADTSSSVLEGEYQLSDFIRLEMWLSTSNPKPTEQIQVKHLDLDKLRFSKSSFEILEKNQIGYLLANAAPLQATKIQLNDKYRPAAMFVSGTFQFNEVTRADAIALDEVGAKTNYRFPLDQRITNHTTTQRLTLKVHSNERIGLPEQIVSVAGTAQTAADVDTYLHEEVRYPIANANIKTLAANLLEQPNTEDKLAKLVTLVNQQLLYTDGQPAGSVNHALQTGRGECTDFADLTTTIARAAGIPGRTIYGLVYNDGRTPAMVFHAWNEVFLDNTWFPVDTTWRQTTADATHIPLDDAQAAAIMLAHSKDSVRFEVVEVVGR